MSTECIARLSTFCKTFLRRSLLICSILSIGIKGEAHAVAVVTQRDTVRGQCSYKVYKIIPYLSYSDSI